jgi:hypothetical protein
VSGGVELSGRRPGAFARKNFESYRRAADLGNGIAWCAFIGLSAAPPNFSQRKVSNDEVALTTVFDTFERS